MYSNCTLTAKVSWFCFSLKCSTFWSLETLLSLRTASVGQLHYCKTFLSFIWSLLCSTTTFVSSAHYLVPLCRLDSLRGCLRPYFSYGNPVTEKISKATFHNSGLQHPGRGSITPQKSSCNWTGFSLTWGFWYRPCSPRIPNWVCDQGKVWNSDTFPSSPFRGTRCADVQRPDLARILALLYQCCILQDDLTMGIPPFCSFLAIVRVVAQYEIMGHMFPNTRYVRFEQNRVHFQFLSSGLCRLALLATSQATESVLYAGSSSPSRTHLTSVVGDSLLFSPQTTPRNSKKSRQTLKYLLLIHNEEGVHCPRPCWRCLRCVDHPVSEGLYCPSCLLCSGFGFGSGCLFCSSCLLHCPNILRGSGSGCLFHCSDC